MIPKRYFQRPKASKYHAEKCTFMGIQFDSKGEMERYMFLKDQERSGRIQCLNRQVSFPLIPTQREMVVKHLKTKDKLVERVAFLGCSYVADFVYIAGGKLVVEDFKGLETDVFKLKEKLFYLKYHAKIKKVRKVTESI